MSNKFYLMAILAFFSCHSGKEKAVNNKEVLNALQEYYYTNKTSFDSLTVQLADTAIGNIEIRSIVNRMKIKKNDKGYEGLFYDEKDSYGDQKSFSVKELGYGIDCGFYYFTTQHEDYFENPRLIYKRITGNWFSYIYFN